MFLTNANPSKSNLRLIAELLSFLGYLHKIIRKLNFLLEFLMEVATRFKSSQRFLGPLKITDAGGKTRNLSYFIPFACFRLYTKSRALLPAEKLEE